MSTGLEPGNPPLFKRRRGKGSQGVQWCNHRLDRLEHPGMTGR